MPVPTLEGGFRNRDFMYATAHEAREDVMAAYRRACLHADATIESLTLDATGHVSWWGSDVSLFSVLVHMLLETTQHLGHADIIREALDGAVGATTNAAEHVRGCRVGNAPGDGRNRGPQCGEDLVLRSG
ncbi:mycothiol transferase [Arthrobacter halodurans]|uniref:DUF664 domain-containing protein n=1 Tax=Arthrobacter halodurans TaxID=516699 RepID=A0ABV4UKW0_9MICC